MMLKDKNWVNAIGAVAVVAILIYLLNGVFSANYKAYDTETAKEAVEQEKISVNAFVVRDEQYINGEAGGTLVSLVTDGERVARGDLVARTCASAADAADYSALLEAQKEREHLLTLNAQSELNALDMEKLNSEADDCFTRMLSVAGSGNYAELSKSVSEFEDKLTSKQILTDGSIDLSEKIIELDKTIDELSKKSITTTEIAAPLSGYYISNADGCENTIDYDKIDEITVASVQSALKSEPAAVPGKMGKIVAGYKWYLTCVIDSKYSMIFEQRDRIKINFPAYGYESVPARIEKISSAKDGKIAVAISCDMMNETYANMRTENVEIVVKEYDGYKIKSSSIRELVDGNNEKISVVYILRGNIMNARKIEILYDNGEYAIVSKNTKASGGCKPISLYDEVILKGRNLKDGKSVG